MKIISIGLQLQMMIHDVGGRHGVYIPALVRASVISFNPSHQAARSAWDHRRVPPYPQLRLRGLEVMRARLVDITCALSVPVDPEWELGKMQARPSGATSRDGYEYLVLPRLRTGLGYAMVSRREGDRPLQCLCVDETFLSVRIV